MAGIPDPYASAPKLSADARAALAAARLVWDSLTKAQQNALVEIRWTGYGQFIVAGSVSTATALRRRGLVDGSRVLTALGALVREVGTRKAVEP